MENREDRRSELSTTVSEFIAAFKDKYTYDFGKNAYMLFGLLWGIPIPLFSVIVDFYASGDSLTLGSVLAMFINRPIHFFFLLHPVIFSILFGALGSIRKQKDEKVWELVREVSLLSILDPVIGVFNRRYFDRRLGDEVVRASRYSRYLSVMIIDIDNFKFINDKHGHLQGDTMLVETANLIKSNIRAADVLCRFGGDEFAVICPETAGSSTRVTAEKIRSAVESYSYKNVSDRVSEIRSSVSIGISDFSDSSTDRRTLVEQADKALYSAKSEGRNKVVQYTALQKT
jgi:diguanylate cyclase (GGDEF)-like protein